ncbi:MAG: TonB-dependent receptor [Flavobacteriales bacterium]|nr:MAG: TonB-dependent receptor [Flavobacteriales bacterium]
MPEIIIKNFKQMKTIILTLTFLLLMLSVNAQKSIKGSVIDTNKESVPLANVYWKNTTIGVVADANGNFVIIEPTTYPATLIVSFVGYQSDTITLNAFQNKIKVELQSVVGLDEFQVIERQSGTFINTIDPIHVETLTSNELAKAACCNISESFETNASVDVNFTDAVSGAKKIQMLGLDGIYTQIQYENLPLVRGLSAAYGLTFVPGTQASSIQIKKGAGSVINGYESITGQINIELQKPDKADKLYLNLYGNIMSRGEINLQAAQKLNNKWSTLTMLHTSTQQISHDNNNDNFHDHPIRTQYNVFNRWKYRGKKRMFQAGFRAVFDDLSAGQIKANEQEPLYYIGVKTKQFEVFTKNGFLFPKKPYKSIGIINSFRFHDHQSKYGQKSYNAQQYSGYMNVIYQTILNSTDHKIKMGGSFVYDNYDKNLNKSYKFGKVEMVPGAFVEYAYNNEKKTALVLGLRGDHHNTFGAFITPRAHYKYSFTDRSAFRLSAGRGFRTANPIIENSGAAMASARNIVFNDTDLLPEIAWNYGTSITHKFELAQKEMGISLDYYYTDFTNKVVVDYENPREISFYNLDGKSFSHSLQVEYNIEITKALELKAAYKWYNIKTTYSGELKDKPLTPKNRVLVNLGYITNFDKWKFDLTGHWYDVSRIPSTTSNSPEYVIDAKSLPFYTLNGQVTRAFKKFEVYAGVENILNYKQENPIISANNPNGSNFDASLIWGPVMGRNIYFGLRYKIK